MTPTGEGRQKVAQYLNHEISLFALNEWSLEFGDDLAQTLDADSMEIAGLVTELVHELQSGELDEPHLRSRLAASIQAPMASQHR
jgi:hypothetical protein